jgi:hypothetical protein
MSAATTIRLTGTLGHDAMAYTGRAGDAWLRLEIHQALHNVAAVAHRCYGAGPAAHIAAHAAARHLRQNARVTVHAERWHIGLVAGHPCLELDGVTHIDHQPAIAHRRHAGAARQEEETA